MPALRDPARSATSPVWGDRPSPGMFARLRGPTRARTCRSFSQVTQPGILWGMAGGGLRRGSAIERLRGAPVYSLRWRLYTFSLISAGLAIWGAATGRRGVAFGGVAASILLLVLAVGAQNVAERSGAVERDRVREEEHQTEISGWPPWKRIAFLLVGLVLGVGLLALRIWSDSSPPG